MTRLRVTALPTALDTTKPARDGGLCLARACTTRVGLPTRTPLRTTERNSSEARSRWGAGNTAAGVTSAGEADAALATTVRQDGATGAGAHAEAEAMGAAATPVARLESALAHANLPNLL